MAGDGFKALSDPTRRKILELLGDGDLTVGEIGAHFDMSKATLSHHLDVLREAGLVSSERHGRHIIYSLETTVLQDIIAWFYNITDKEQ